MNITILDNRDVIINSSDNLGTQNENNASIINFSFPESLMNANKKIVFITDDGNYWDLITNNSYKITNAVSKYKNVSVYVWLVDEQNDIDFRSKIWNVSFNKNEEPDDIVPTEEEISGFDTMITQLNQGLEELDEEKIKLRREYEKVEEGLEDLDEALIQVNNVDIDVSKSGNTSTITITNKEGVEKNVQIEDGTDYVITQEDYQAIANVVETDIAPLMPTKTSDLVNDSGFIDNTVNNLTNYYDKTTSDGKYALISESGYSLQLNINSSTYVMTLKLKNKNGTVLSTGTVDLPLETMVVNASYDSLTKEIVLTLQNGNTVRFSVADLVSGLQAEITSSNKLASDLVDDTNQTNKFVTTSEKTTWNAKYVKPSEGIPKTDLSSAVQTSLGKADSALQEHQDISGKEDKTNKVTSIDENSTDTQYPSAKLLYDQLAEKQAEIDGLVTENTAFKKQISTEHISTTSTQLTDSAEDLPIEHVKLKGQTSQVQYEGRNKLRNSLSILQTNNTSGIWNDNKYVLNDVTFTVNNDLSITANGTASQNVSFYVNRTGNYETTNLSAGTYYLTSHETTGSNSTWKLQYSVGGNNYNIFGTGSNQEVEVTLTEESTVVATIIVYAEKTVNNVAFYPMISTSSDTDYEKYVGGQPAPNPSYPQLIHRVTGDCNAKVQNKNLWGGITFTRTSQDVVFELKEDGTMTINGTATGLKAYSYNDKNITNNNIYITLPAGTYNYRIDNPNNDLQYQLYELPKDSTTITMLSSSTSETITIEEAKQIGVRINVPVGVTLNNYTAKIIIEKGSTSSDYIAHAEQNAPLSLGNIEAYEGDEIQIDFVQKAGYKKVTGARFVQHYYTRNFRGEFRAYYSQYNRILLINSSAPTTLKSKAKAYCPIAVNKPNVSVNTIQENAICIRQANNDTGVACNLWLNSITDEQSAQDFVANNDIIITYELETPVTTPITDPTLLAQFETLINMKTYKETTNIESTGADLAPVIEFDYYQDMSTIKSRIFSYDSATQTLTITI